MSNPHWNFFWLTKMCHDYRSWIQWCTSVFFSTLTIALQLETVTVTVRVRLATQPAIRTPNGSVPRRLFGATSVFSKCLFEVISYTLLTNFVSAFLKSYKIHEIFDSKLLIKILESLLGYCLRILRILLKLIEMRNADPNNQSYPKKN